MKMRKISCPNLKFEQKIYNCTRFFEIRQIQTFRSDKLLLTLGFLFIGIHWTTEHVIKRYYDFIYFLVQKRYLVRLIFASRPQASHNKYLCILFTKILNLEKENDRNYSKPWMRESDHKPCSFYLLNKNP